MNSKKLSELVLLIREYSLNKRFTICKKSVAPDWKNQLLSLLSDDVVNNHLRTLHPFQYTRGNEATQVYEFCISNYRYKVYLKINIRQCEVLSFHCDDLSEDEFSPAFTTKDSYYYSQNAENNTALSTDITVIPEPTLYGTKGWICRFAIGSQITTVPVYPNVQDGFATIPLQDYFDAIQTMAKGFQKQYLLKVIERAQLHSWALVSATDSYYTLSYDPADPVQMASIGFDLYNSFPELYSVRDLAVDLLLQVQPQTMKMLESQLHLTMNKALPPAISRETLLEDYDC